MIILARPATERLALALFLWTAIVPANLARAEGRTVSEDVPVRGGIAALARAIGIAHAPDAARFAAELPRLIFGAAPSPPLTEYFAALSASNSVPQDVVPMPLSTAVWSAAIFRRPLASDDLIAAVLADRSAALLCRGLAGLDDETLAFFLDHHDALRRIYERDAAVFAAFADALQIHSGRVVLPGGEGARPEWEAVVGAPVDRPEAFVQELFSRGRGRLAYLYASVARLDPPHRAFALGATVPPADRIGRFQALATITDQMTPEWDVRQRPFTRPTHDVSLLLDLVRVNDEGTPRAPATKAFWTRVLGEVQTPGETDDFIDAAWLADRFTRGQRREREERFEQFAFAQRALGDDWRADHAADVVAAYPQYPMLLLALERAGVRDASTYAAIVSHARRLDGTSDRAIAALTQFQAVVALLSRAVRVKTIAPAAADALLRQLSAIQVDSSGGYAGAAADWIADSLLPALGGTLDTADATLVAAAAGPPASAPLRIIWEDRAYHVDLAGSERRRIQNARERLSDATVTAALDARLARPVGAPAHGAKSDVVRADDTLSRALRTLVYAADIGDPDTTMFLGGDLSARHNFGVASRDRTERLRLRWAEPHEEVVPGRPWHLTGSLLNLDLAFAPDALRRMDASRPARPMLNSNERDVFARSVALMNPYDLTDGQRDRIVAAIDRGRALADGGTADLETAMTAAGMDGWRRRAIRWSRNRGEPSAPFFSLTELLVAGGGYRVPGIDAWGMSARQIDGCVCTRLFAPRWTLFEGRPQLGLFASQIADVNLAIAAALRERQLPAALARGVAALAVQEFMDHVMPTDDGDWMTVVRGAQSLDSDRVDDYVAALAADGPLMPERSSHKAGAR